MQTKIDKFLNKGNIFRSHFSEDNIPEVTHKFEFPKKYFEKKFVK